MTISISDHISSASLCLEIWGRKHDGHDAPLLGPATGFIFKSGQENFLITNRHVVAGRDENGKIAHSQGGVPTVLKIKGREITIFLYEDAEYERAIWYEHPIYREKIDVVAIPVKGTLPVAINEHNCFIHDMKVDIGMEVFVVGYPRGINAQGTPMWKRASIASTPTINVDNLPKMLIDTATREGMSGSPVIMVPFSSIYYKENNPQRMIDMPQKARLIGVYSGRILNKTDFDDNRQDPFFAQLGIVWKDKVIQEIIEGKTCGDNQF